MIKFPLASIERRNAVKAFLIDADEAIPGLLPYNRYRKWLKQFGAEEIHLQIVINNEEDATAFKLRFGGRQ